MKLLPVVFVIFLAAVASADEWDCMITDANVIGFRQVLGMLQAATFGFPPELNKEFITGTIHGLAEEARNALRSCRDIVNKDCKDLHESMAKMDENLSHAMEASFDDIKKKLSDYQGLKRELEAPLQAMESQMKECKQGKD